MRAELKTIALIEKYLLNVLSETETLAFETRMRTEPNFRNDVTLQKQLIHSLERISLQQSILNAQQTYQFYKILKLVGFITIPIVIAVTTWYVIHSSVATETITTTLPTKVAPQIQENQKVDINEDVVTTKDISVNNKPSKNPKSSIAILASDNSNDSLNSPSSKKVQSTVYESDKHNTTDEVIENSSQEKKSQDERIKFIRYDDPILFGIVEIPPVFPGCENVTPIKDLRECVTKKIQMFVNREINMDTLTKLSTTNAVQKVDTKFIIDTSGIVTDIDIRTDNPAIAKEIKRVIQSLPKMIPGMQKGKNVSVKCILPISFKISK